MRLSRVVPVLLVCCTLLRASVGSAEAACSAKPAKPATAVEQAYKDGKYDQADGLLIQALEAHPSDISLNAALVHTLLHEGRVDDAAGRVSKSLEEHPESAEALTALAEVQVRQGHPWLAAQSLDHAAAIDPCYARVHLVRSRIYRMDSMYASERAELTTAYQLDPSDPDIWHNWLQIIRPAKEIEGISESLKTTPNLDADIREKAIASEKAMRLLLTENSQTCQEAVLSAPVSLPLIASHTSVKEVSAYKLRVDLPKSTVRLVVDTAASGLYITRAAADANGFVHDDTDPQGTVRAANLRVGPLELHNCLIGVSDSAFADGGEGFIGTDVFSSYMVTLNFPQASLELGLLPGQTADLPGDRPSALEREGFTPVLHRNQYLLLPVTLNKTERQLFVLDTGIRMTTMTAAAAHAVSNMRVNFTNTLKTLSGGSLQVYRDSFDLQFAGMGWDRQKQIIEFDASKLNENMGLEVAGLMGFNILQNLSMQIDYRDGLVKFTLPVAGSVRMDIATNGGGSKSANILEEDDVCNHYTNQNADQPIKSMLEAIVPGGFDSARLKSGQAITVRVMRDWGTAACTLTPNANLYGRVMASTSSKNGGPSKLSVVFDHGDCSGHPRQELDLRLIAIAGGDQQFKALHNDLPTEVQGGGRSIRAVANNQGLQEDDNMAPELGPALVHPGIVSGIKNLKLIPEGGPQCSTLLTSEARSVRLESGTELILSMQQGTP